MIPKKLKLNYSLEFSSEELNAKIDEIFIQTKEFHSLIFINFQKNSIYYQMIHFTIQFLVNQTIENNTTTIEDFAYEYAKNRCNITHEYAIKYIKSALNVVLFSEFIKRFLYLRKNQISTEKNVFEFKEEHLDAYNEYIFSKINLFSSFDKKKKKTSTVKVEDVI